MSLFLLRLCRGFWGPKIGAQGVMGGGLGTEVAYSSFLGYVFMLLGVMQLPQVLLQTSIRWDALLEQGKERRGGGQRSRRKS